MRILGLIALVFLITLTASVLAQAQATAIPTAPEIVSTAVKPPVEIVRYKIGMDYYPMLDRPSLTTPPMTADIGELPPTENERLARQSRRPNYRTTAPIAPEDKRSRGRLSSYLRVINDAQIVQIVVKNTEKKIKSLDWDFAFPRYEDGKLLARYDVLSKVEIEPGGKKTLKYHLPAGAKKCEVVRVVRDEKQTEKTSTFEAVCGRGFNDPLLHGQRQETVSIKRIAFADGTSWSRE